MGYSWVVKFWVALMVYIVCNKICLIQGGGALHRGEGKGTPPNVWYLVVTFSDFIGNICRRTWVGYRASSIPAEIFDIRLAGWHMFRHDNYVVERASWRSCPTHLSDQEPAPSQLKYLMLTQLVSTCLHIIFMKQQDHPGGLVPPICQIQS